MYVLAIIKDVNSHTVGARIVAGKAQGITCSTEQLKQMFMQYGSSAFENAILTKNGFVRAKSGEHLSIEPYYPSNPTSNFVIVYHGSPNKTFTPEYGFGSDKQDYGRGFYTTPYENPAKEWAVYLGSNGYLHTYTLDLSGLSVLSFDNLNPLCWIAELMKHRDADESEKYRRLAPQFIKKFGISTAGYDVIEGWRADSSYFQIAKCFVRGEFDYELLPTLLRQGSLKQQICIKSRKAYSRLKECEKPKFVPSSVFLPLYTRRDNEARQSVKRIITSDSNTMTHGFDYVMREDFML